MQLYLKMPIYMYEDYFYIRIQMKSSSSHKFRFYLRWEENKILSYIGNCMSIVLQIYSSKNYWSI